jgi:hypothetical protein
MLKAFILHALVYCICIEVQGAKCEGWEEFCVWGQAFLVQKYMIRTTCTLLLKLPPVCNTVVTTQVVRLKTEDY